MQKPSWKGRRWSGISAGAAIMMLAGGLARSDDNRRVVSGLRQPVEIVRDRWGIAHLYARTEQDLFLAQG